MSTQSNNHTKTPLVYFDQWMSAQELARDHPDSFEIPTPEELDGLKEDDLVKVCNGKERFWVVLTKVDHSLDYFEGRVNNQLVYKKPYNYDDLISFKKENIYVARSQESRKLFVHTFLNLYITINKNPPNLDDPGVIKKMITLQKYFDSEGSGVRLEVMEEIIIEDNMKIKGREEIYVPEIVDVGEGREGIINVAMSGPSIIRHEYKYFR